MIRPARPADIGTLQAIEVAAGEPFRAVGMAAVADDDPPSVTVYEHFIANGWAWVLVTDGAPVAYLLAEIIDAGARVEQVSVHPAQAGHGHGRSLLEELASWARERRLPALTLTTFAEVPWNAPYYVRLGFRELADGELTADLRRVRADEMARGLDRWPRVAMLRPL